MGAVASGCHEKSGDVIAVIPTFLNQIENPKNYQYKKRVVKTLFERKKRDA